MRNRYKLMVALLLSLLFAAVALAQTATVGQLRGVVKDPTGAVLPGVTVEVKHQEMGFTRSATTDTTGSFRFASLPLGAYTVTATLSGFESAKSRNNLVELERTTDVTMTLKLGATAEAITVTGEVPLVDKTNVTARTHVKSEDFQKLPVGRNYQSLMGVAPGVTGTGNVNAHGALSSANLFLFDGVDVTDATTGTFGGNLNFEAIQELTMYTAGASAEYGRATGAVVNVITKSGGNALSGSAKWIGSNDKWNEQNKTHNEACRTASPPTACKTTDSLARTKFDHVNPVQSYTLGGPIWRDRAWFFGAYEKSKSTTPQRQTLVSNENYQQTTVSPFWDAKVTTQIGPSHNVLVKKHSSPTNGFIIDYWGGSADLGALTGQDQTANSITGQWTGVFGSNFTADALVAKTGETITVGSFSLSPLTGGAPHINLADGLAYNGATFVGAVDRPRRQAAGAVTYFHRFGPTTHNIKAGYDWQSVKSTNVFGYPNNQYYIDNTFDWKTKTFEPNQRRDYDVPIPSTSKGKMTALYIRDKFDIANRWFIEGGLRYETEKGESDIGQATVDATDLAPRFSMSYDLKGDGKSFVLATAGRFYQFILQDLSDRFAQVAPQSNYTNYTWDAAKNQYVQSGRVTASGNSFTPNTSLNPSYHDELTAGFQQQFGNTVGVGVRGVYRKWHDLIDDIRGFNPDGTTFRQVVNYGPARRQYKGLELTFEKRFSRNWYVNANYTEARTTGNNFDSTFSSLGDYIDAQCRTTVDPTIGTNGTISCLEVQEGRNKNGRASYDRPHDLKAQAAYTFRFGPVSLTAGTSGEYISGLSYTATRTVNVLKPGTTTNAGPTATYFYEPRGSHRLQGYYQADGSLEATYRIYRGAEVGFKGEVFNLNDHQAKTNLTNTTWCGNTNNPSASCTTARNLFGTATARGQFLAPRTYRITTLLRF